jgi:uncharacterized membrane protein YdfJ with MMPL/SSD domain
MLITYRRSGGLVAVLTFTVVALAATVVTVTVAATVLIVALAVAASAVLTRAALRLFGRHRVVQPAAGWSRDTIDTTAVHTIGSAPARDPLRIDR